MMRVTLVLALALAASGAEQKAKKAVKADCEEKATKLTKQVEELKEQLAAGEAKLAGGAGGSEIGELSVLGAISSAGSLVGSAFQQALDCTDLDEQCAAHFETAKAASVDAMGKVSSIDLGEQLNAVTSHDLYKTHVAPALDVASKKYVEHVKPLVDQHVNPAFEQAKTAASQTMDTALPVLDQHKATVTNGLSQVPGFLHSVEAKLGELLAPLFDFAAKGLGSRARILPKRPLDRLLFLVILILFLYNTVFVAKFIANVALKVLTTATKTTFKLAIVLPLRIVVSLLGWATYFMTCFYCCGLCRSRRGSKGSEKETKGKEKKEEKKAEPVKKATVEEIVQLLESSKKKGKIDDAVKLLCSREKDCKAMDGKAFPEHIRGKVLDKATLKKAFGNFKEIDQKKLDWR